MADYTIDNSSYGARSETKALLAKVFGFMAAGLFITF